MTAVRSRAEAVFLEALGTPAEQRDALIEERCAGDAALLAEVRSLLSYHDEDSSFLDHAKLRETAVSLLGDTPAPAAMAPPPPPGTRIGGYTLRSVIGSGGMGIVYLAEQEKPRRTVALKIIRPGTRSADILRRFEHEAEVLARLQHPGIAQVYEAGTADLSESGGPQAQPFIAMELVSGPPLHEHASRAGLDARARLELIARVCDAVQHAHQRGIIHRDLKPANILVDASGQPKVLDFGVARITAGDARETMQTGAGQLIGTLAYMSPEQMLGDPDEVDTRADVYALGVILHQLLSGALPYPLEGKLLVEAVRIVREEDPGRLSSIDRSMRGEVETIVAKALAKDRQRRYQSASDLAQDIRRYLDGRPIAAKDDSAFYVLRKQINRHKIAVGAASLLLTMLSAFAVYAQVQSAHNRELARSEAAAKDRALGALKEASDARALADETSRRLEVELVTANTERGRLTARLGNLAAAEDLIWPGFLANPSSAQAHWALWDVYSRQPCLAYLKAHKGPIRAISLNADGSRLYTGGDDGYVRVWSVETGECLAPLEGHKGFVHDLSLLESPARLASASADGTVIVRDLPSLEVRSKIIGLKGGALCVCLSPNGEFVACGCGDGSVRLYETLTGKFRRELHRHHSHVNCVRWSPDGSSIVSCGSAPDDRILLWDLHANTTTPLEAPDQEIVALAFSPDSLTLASAGRDYYLRLWEVTSRQPTRKIATPTPIGQDLEFTADGRSLLMGGWLSTDVWDLAGEQRKQTLSVRESAYSNAISASGARVAAGFGDGWARVWDLSAAGATLHLTGHNRRAVAALSPDNRTVITGDAAGAVRVWNAATGEMVTTWESGSSPIRVVRLSRDGRTLLIGSEDRTLRVWNVSEQKLIGQLPVSGEASSMAAAFLGAGTRIAVASPGGALRVLSLPDLAVVAERPPEAGDVVEIVPTPDESMLLLRRADRGLRLWRPDGAAAPGIPNEAHGWTMRFNADGSLLASVYPDSGVALWDTRTWQRVDVLSGEGALSGALVWHPTDPSVLFAGAASGIITMWDVPGRRALLRLEELGPFQVILLTISGDGRRLGVSGGGRTAVIWDLARFDRHIAGNLEYQIQRQAPTLAPGAKIEAARQWARNVINDRAGRSGSEPH